MRVESHHNIYNWTIIKRKLVQFKEIMIKYHRKISKRIINSVIALKIQLIIQGLGLINSKLMKMEINMTMIYLQITNIKRIMISMII